MDQEAQISTYGFSHLQLWVHISCIWDFLNQSWIMKICSISYWYVSAYLRHVELFWVLIFPLKLIWSVYPHHTSMLLVIWRLAIRPTCRKHPYLLTLGCIMFGLGQKVLSRLAWSKFRPFIAIQEFLTDYHGNEAKTIFWKKNQNGGLNSQNNWDFQNCQF